jgi:glycosyltransferase involved in cell wall biosynthesis
MQKISAYVLTKNSERHLDTVLKQLLRFADEVLILDSGSDDGTVRIASINKGVRILIRKFDNFKAQRNYAALKCNHDWIFFADSDEIPDDELVNAILELKQKEFEAEAYFVQREWHALGEKVHVIYPVISPDLVVRLFDKRKVSFNESSTVVHETLGGFSKSGILAGKLTHMTFESKFEIKRKLKHYTTLAAQDIKNAGKPITAGKIYLSPLAAFIKWYFIKGGYKDGKVGFILARYAYSYTKMKYQKARE